MPAHSAYGVAVAHLFVTVCRLANVTTLLPFFALLSPPAGTNVTVNNVSELYFYVVDSTNVVTVYELVAGQVSITGPTDSEVKGEDLLQKVVHFLKSLKFLLDV